MRELMKIKLSYGGKHPVADPGRGARGARYPSKKKKKKKKREEETRRSSARRVEKRSLRRHRRTMAFWNSVPLSVLTTCGGLQRMHSVVKASATHCAVCWRSGMTSAHLVNVSTTTSTQWYQPVRSTPSSRVSNTTSLHGRPDTAARVGGKLVAPPGQACAARQRACVSTYSRQAFAITGK